MRQRVLLHGVEGDVVRAEGDGEELGRRGGRRPLDVEDEGVPAAVAVPRRRVTGGGGGRAVGLDKGEA